MSGGNRTFSFRGREASSLMTVGAGVGDLVAGYFQAQQEEALAKMQASALEVDDAAIALQARRKRAVLRQERALAGGSIRAAAAASGVVADSGSVATALRVNAEQAAREEMDVRLEERSARRTLRQQQREIRRAGSAQADARRRQAIGRATGALGELLANLEVE